VPARAIWRESAAFQMLERLAAMEGAIPEAEGRGAANFSPRHRVCETISSEGTTMAKGQVKQGKKNKDKLTTKEKKEKKKEKAAKK
jgi:hypothetical protein